VHLRRLRAASGYEKHECRDDKGKGATSLHEISRMD
jgi:hypothetical protein